MIGIGKRLHIAVVGDRDRLVSPFHGALYDILDIRYTVHIAHLVVAVQLHTLLRRCIHADRCKIRDLLDADDRADRKVTVKLVDRSDTL